MLNNVFVLMLAVAAAGACSGSKESQPAAQPSAAQSTASAQPNTVAADADAATPAAEINLPPELRGITHKPFSGDFDEMAKRRMIRVGVTYNRTFYFVDNGAQRGLAYEFMQIFDDDINKKLKTGNLKIHSVLIPLRRDALLPALRDGLIDVVVAQMTVTPERQALVDFTNPTRRGVDEVVVTGPGAPPLTKVDDLSGREVFVRESSSYYQSLLALNKRLAQQGNAPVDIQLANESLEDDDLLEMVNAGLIPATVIDSYFAEFWNQIFTEMTVHSDIAVRTDGVLAVAIRKNSPKLAAVCNEFIEKHGMKSAITQILSKRYLQSTKYAKNARSEAERKKFQTLATLFKQYGDQYQFDYLMMAAQAFQESRLDQSARSQVGAIGVMQLMPETGKEQKVGDINQLEPNIHAGVKYMRFMRDEYFQDEPMSDVNKALFTFASYNAGPGRIRQLRRETAKRGLDPNVWFANVEQVVSERIGRETVTYVSNIYKYYLAYRLISEENARRKDAKAALSSGKK
jgi:membrane-bound lytic murein transglycosylase MltF